MTRSRLWNVLIAALVAFGPLVGAIDRLVHPGPWIAFVAGVLLLVTQPPIGPRAMVRDKIDKRSALGIFAGMIACQLAALIEFGYRDTMRPAPMSWFVFTGAILVAFGLILRIWAIRTLGRFFTATVRVQSDQRVVQDGPYRRLRHPSYTGTLLVSLGIAIALASVVGVLLTLLFVIPAYVHRIRIEERSLLEGLGDEYRGYSAKTWRLVPLLY